MYKAKFCTSEQQSCETWFANGLQCDCEAKHTTAVSERNFKKRKKLVRKTRHCKHSEAIQNKNNKLPWIKALTMTSKCAFTLTEVIIVLVILGALALILVPNMMNMVPDDHNIKYKKAFYTIQEIINDIINDGETCQELNATVSGNEINYSEPNSANKDNVLTMCADINHNTPSVTARTLDVEICKRLSTNQTCGIAGNNTNLLTTNGMRWYLPNQSLRNTDNSSWNTTIYVDVDGGNASPTKRDADKGWYRINIDSTGKVTAPNDTAGESGSNKTEQQLLIDNPTD